MREGKLVKGIGGFYYIYENGQIFTLKAKKNMTYRGLKLLVGDNVHFNIDGENAWIEDIIPRKNFLNRPAVANLDVLGIVISSQPKPDYNMLDILLITAFKQNIKPIIIHNKSDMGIDAGIDDYKKTGVDIFYVSATKNTGIEELKDAIRGKTTCLAGQSGVGKSTITNALLGTNIETGDISKKIKRGRHTTRHVEIHYANDILLFDTPGFSAMELLKEIEPEQIQFYYPEFQEALKECYFQPCLHMSEPNCSVNAKMLDGDISINRLQRYRELVAIAQENRRNKYV